MARSSRRSSKGRSRTVFARRNYVLLLIGIALVAVGFALMRIDGQFESVVSLYIAPLLILGGYLEVIYAILWQPSSPS
ncbi:MAG: DUF3098 domain-containing protein [Bacteroidetes bacterium QS_8_68_28]|nr:MAG: DUF3098 domain-containing protein [Bacteroidetes bacterium QS_8_68_28]